MNARPIRHSIEMLSEYRFRVLIKSVLVADQEVAPVMESIRANSHGNEAANYSDHYVPA
jgi:hypothetical protein